MRRWLRCRGARWPHSVLLFAAAAVLPFFFSTAPVGTASTVYRNAMADLPLACLFGGALCLYQAAGGRRGGFYAVALPLAVLAMTKDIGLAYGLIAVFLIGVDQLFGTQQPEGWRRLRVFGYRLARTALLAVPVLAVFVSWSRYTAAMAPEAGSSTVGSAQMSYGAVLLGGVRQLLGIGREARFAELMQTMAQALVSRRVCLLGPPAVVLGLVAGLSLLAFLAAPRGALRRRVAAGFFASAFCFAALYLFHLILYFYNFSETEAAALKDYERYLMPFLQGWTVGRAVPAGPVRRGGPGAHAAPPPGRGGRRPGSRWFFGGVCLARRAHGRVLDPRRQPLLGARRRQGPRRGDERGARLERPCACHQPGRRRHALVLLQVRAHRPRHQRLRRRLVGRQRPIPAAGIPIL